MPNIKTFETSWLQSSCSDCVSPFEPWTTSSWHLTGNPFSPGSPFGPGAPCEEMLTEKLVWCSSSHQKKEHILSLIAAFWSVWFAVLLVNVVYTKITQYDRVLIFSPFPHAEVAYRLASQAPLSRVTWRSLKNQRLVSLSCQTKKKQLNLSKESL